VVSRRTILASCTLSLAIIAVGASGCTQQPTAQDSQEPDWEELYLDNLAGLAARFEADHGRPPPDDATFIRFIDANDYGRVHAECVREHGFDASETFDGGVIFGDVAQDQALALAEAHYRCEAAYPVHPRHFSTVPTDEDLRRAYDYLVDELMPCLIAEGYEVGPPPTWEVFRDSPLEGRWHPYHFFDPQSEAEWQRVNETCPQSLSMRDFFGSRQD
jgi:hypothetical protein